MEIALEYFSKWDGDMREDSIAASIYMRYVLNFYKTLFHKQIPDSLDDRFSLSDSHTFL